MSQRTTTVISCDLCGKDLPDARKAFTAHVRGCARPVDVGPCCAGRTIADLAAASNKLHQRKEAAPQPEGITP